MQIYIEQLTPQQAGERLRRYTWQIYVSQFEARFVMLHPDPAASMRIAARLYWTGVVKDLHASPLFHGGIADWIVDKIKSALEWFWNTIIKPGIDAALAGLGWIADRARDLIVGAFKTALVVGGWLVEGIKSAVGFVWDKISDVFTWLTNVAKAIWDGIVSTLGMVWDFLKGIGGVIAGALRGFFEWIWSGIQWVGERIWEGVRWVATRTAEVIQAAWRGITSFIERLIGEITGAISWLWEGIKGLFTGLIDAVKGVFKWIWDNVLVPVGRTVIEAFRWVWNKLVEIVTGFVRWLLDVLRAWAPMTPERAPNAMIEILKMGASALVALGGLTLIGEAVHPLKQMGFPHLSAIFYDLSGYKLVTGAAFTALGICMFRMPLTYFFQNVFRPKMPDKRDVIEARSRGLIDEPTAKRMMGYHGYSDDYFYIWEDFSKTPVRYFALRAVASGGYYDHDLFEDDMRRTGYPPETRLMLHHMYQYVQLERPQREVLSHIIRRFALGFTTRQQFESELASYSIPPAHFPFLATVAELRRDLELREELVAGARDAFRRGAIEEPALLEALEQAGMDPETAFVILERERVRRREDRYQTREEEVRAYGRGTIIRRYREGMISETEFREEMRMLGYTPPQMERFLTLARLEYDYDFAMDQLRIAQEAYRVGVIDDAGFLAWLAEIPIGVQRARAYLFRERIRKVKKR